MKSLDIIAMPKLPAFQFYPADWLNDIKLQSCSLSAQGLLVNLMCLMHQANPYGYLTINNLVPDDKTVAKLLRLHHKTYHSSLIELLLYGVLKRSETGVIYCARMVEDEQLRDVRRKAGKLGGSPLLKQTVKQEVKQKSTPSSSSSSSIIKNTHKKRMSNDFELTEKLKAYALGKGIFENEIKEIFEHFKNNHGAKGTVMLDWDKAWYTWVRNEIKFNFSKYQHKQPQKIYEKD